MAYPKSKHIAYVLALTVGVLADGAPAEPRPNHLAAVRAYADCLIKHGRDTYGAVHSPLFAEALDRRTLRLLEGEALARVEAMKFAEWGIRPHDRMIRGANPMHCENFYQLLYALTEISGERKYRAEADRSLQFFFEHCQGPATGLLYWGEHAGWDLTKDAPRDGTAAQTHEFFRPWVLWEHSWRLAPAACQRFALGLWEHQIGDHRTGLYSRHARIDQHGAQTAAPYPRHGGFYVETWAHAYARSPESVFLQAIETVVDGLETLRRTGGHVVSGSLTTKAGRRERDVSLAVSLWNAAELLPDELATRLRDAARANDEPASLEMEELASPAGEKPNLWSDGYGGFGGEIASAAILRMLRHRQTPQAGYRERILAAAQRYLADEINLSFAVHPGTVGKVIILMLNAHELTGDRRYRQRAEYFADRAVQLFLADGCPLPKATHQHDHYEAVTGADALMMALLQLWAAGQQPPRTLGLVYTDR